MTNNNIIWSNKNNYIIPFGCFGDLKNNCYWQNIFTSIKQYDDDKDETDDDNNNSNKPNIKYVSLMIENKGKYIFNNNKEIKKRTQIKTLTVSNKNDDDLLGLILHEIELNELLFDKVMKYVFEKNKFIQNKLIQYNKLWSLESALWIKRIANPEHLETREWSRIW